MFSPGLIAFLVVVFGAGLVMIWRNGGFSQGRKPRNDGGGDSGDGGDGGGD